MINLTEGSILTNIKNIKNIKTNSKPTQNPPKPT